MLVDVVDDLTSLFRMSNNYHRDSSSYRFSPNCTPSRPLSHPFRHLQHLIAVQLWTSARGSAG
jgi:hypothetical protein